MLTIYLKKLVQEIKNLEFVQCHAQLRGELKHSGFIELAKLFPVQLDKLLSQEQKMDYGTTISDKTLKNIFKGKYDLAYPIPKRKFKTLCKLAIFAGYEGWNHFAAIITEKETKKLATAAPKDRIEALIHKAMEVEFELYAKLPAFQPELLHTVFINKEQGFKSIVDKLLTANKKGWTIANIYNPSYHKLVDYTITQLEDTTAEVWTKQDWLLAWWHLADEKYVHRYKHVSEHTYLLEKTDKHWKIKISTDTAFKIPMEAVPKQKEPTVLTKETIKDLISKAMALELEVYKKLPAYHPELLSSLFINEEAAFKEIAHNLWIASNKTWTIADPTNPSSSNLIDCAIKQINTTTAQVTTKEYWLLWWWNQLDEKYAYRHKEISDHIYLLKRIGDQWKIQSNASGSDSLRLPLE